MSSPPFATNDEYEQFVCSPCKAMIGRTYRIDHLTSEKGKTLNGKTCEVVGFAADHAKNPEARLQCAIIEEGKASSTKMRIKSSNLVPVEATVMQQLMSSSAPLSDSKIVKGLRSGLADHQSGRTERKDLAHRITLYKSLAKKLKAAKKANKSNSLKDEDYCFPCGATPIANAGDCENILDFALSFGRTGCVGNNIADMRLVDLGLKGDGDATCGICTNTLGGKESSEILVTLPCVHMFHDTCLQQWLDSDLGKVHWNCPTCRRTVPHNLATYRVRYETQLRNRFQEFLLSGYCPKCILWHMEKDRNQAVQGIENESGEQLTMGCVGQMQNKVFIRPP